MATVVVLPKFGMTMEEGTIVEWYKKEGEWVEKGAPLLQIETEKLTMDVEAPASGILSAIQAPVGMVVPVYEPLATILARDEEGEGVDATVAPVSEEVPEALPEEGRKVMTEPRPRLLASPVARRLAREAGVDLAAIAGSGPRGQVSKADVEAYLAALEETPAVPDNVRVLPLTGMRKTIADRMASSAREIPHIALTVEVDMTRAEEVRQQLGRTEGSSTTHRVSVTAIVAKVVAFALRRHPRLNARLEADGIWLLPDINLGVAVAVDEGLIVPVIHGADEKTVSELAQLVGDLTEKARAGTLNPDDVTGGTFTVTNLGMYGIDEFEAIINPPQAAILAVGRISKRPVAAEDGVEIRPTVRMTLSADHRILDGAIAADFLRDVRRLLEDPYLLL